MQIEVTVNGAALQVPGDAQGFIQTTAGGLVLPSSSFTRPANTTAYASGQLVANSTTAGSVVPLSWTVARVAGGSGMVRRATVRKSGTSLTNAQFRLHLYTVSPTVANGDGGTLSSNQSVSHLGTMDVTVGQAFSDGANGQAAPNVGGEISFALSAGQTIYGLLEARAAYTPVSGETFQVTLEVLQQ